MSTVIEAQARQAVSEVVSRFDPGDSSPERIATLATRCYLAGRVHGIEESVTAIQAERDVLKGTLSAKLREVARAANPALF